MKGIHIKAGKPKRQSSLPLLQQIDPRATARLWAKHDIKPSLDQYLRFDGGRPIRANLVGVLAVERLGVKAAREAIRLWETPNHSQPPRNRFAELLGLPEPYLAGLDNGFEYGKAEWVREASRKLGLEDGVVVRRLVWPEEAQD